MFTLPIINKIIGNVYDSRTQTIDMLRFKKYIRINASDIFFASDNKFRFKLCPTRDAIRGGGWGVSTSTILKRRVVRLEPPLILSQWLKMNQSLGLIYGRATHHLVIEESIMFTLLILNQIIGNVSDSRPETTGYASDSGFHFRLHKKFPLIENLASDNVLRFNSHGNFVLQH